MEQSVNEKLKDLIEYLGCIFHDATGEKNVEVIFDKRPDRDAWLLTVHVDSITLQAIIPTIEIRDTETGALAHVWFQRLNRKMEDARTVMNAR